jgi:adenylate cyclase
MTKLWRPHRRDVRASARITSGGFWRLRFNPWSKTGSICTRRIGWLYAKDGLPAAKYCDILRVTHSRPLGVPLISIRQLRLYTGLILFTYVTIHLVNHMAGLWSLDAMDRARNILHWPLFNPVGVTVLYGAMLIHSGLALYALFQRRRLTMCWGEAAQLIFGLSIPLLFAGHILGTRMAFSFFGADVNYPFVLLAQWNYDPWIGVRQIIVLLIAWSHGCFGLYYWFRLKPWYQGREPLLFGLAVLAPALSIAGFARGSKDALALAADPAWLAAFQATVRWPSADQIGELGQIQALMFMIYCGLIGAVLVARWVRRAWEKRRGYVRLTYDDGQIVRVPPGGSILDISRGAGVAHASVCGGRGRCSTCRVRVMRGGEHLSPADASEEKVLKRVKAGAQVRLACQAKPLGGALEVVRLLPAAAEAKDGFARPDYIQGKELDVTILFADIRAFTSLSEEKLPYDVVFLLNRYFECVGAAITDSGGYLDKFIGDGVMAIFGIDDGPEAGSRNAINAAREMGVKLAELNKTLENDLDSPIRIGVGLHHGAAIVGEMGYGAATTLTAIGDTVNTASRLESMTKEFGVQLIVAESVATAAKIDLSAFERREADIRGREGVISVFAIENAIDLEQQKGAKTAA